MRDGLALRLDTSMVFASCDVGSIAKPRDSKGPVVNRKNTQLRAYVLRDRTNDDHSRQVAFALTAAGARTGGYDDVPYINTVANRAPQFDEYAGLGYVPVPVLIADGWRFGCGDCWRTVNGCTDGAVADNHNAYCSEACQARAAGRDAGYLFLRKERDAVEADAKRRWPDASVVWCDFNRPAFREPLPEEGFRIYARLFFKSLDACATYWDGNRDHDGLEYMRRSAS